VLIIVFCVAFCHEINKDRFAALATMGIAIDVLFVLSCELWRMVRAGPGGLRLPAAAVSYWRSPAMLVLDGGFGLVQSAHVHKPR